MDAVESESKLRRLYARNWSETVEFELSPGTKRRRWEEEEVRKREGWESLMIFKELQPSV